ncbi:type VII secretion-associated serine protease [Virgisporangium aliadipatigenens]|uniref:Type VII secretion-associated serine protease n=1 Tax=Virgisporangium aliadipatigenens TaxID=741659 RepID=A0A8J4DXS1_9ACTN|nr:type VII secretion-associated serine protease mycosin [Virgisporangium aliadipatigenens]GIJ52362.1 type VII secretion-associated serine protease [Virgisporangium aliadipatigenens]
MVAVIVSLSGSTAASADSVRDQQWHLKFLDVSRAQEIAKGGGVTIAVIDTGVDSEHPDLRGNVLDGFDVNGDPGAGRVDKNGHGTAMAGLIAAHGKGPDGALGIAPEARILPVQVLGPTGSGAGVGEGIRWAVDHGARVVNLSLGGGGGTSAGIGSGIDYARSRDVVVVAAAGNTDRARDVEFPANKPGVVAVGGVDKQGNDSATTVKGEALVVCAPSEDIMTTGLEGKYRRGDGGTSSAAAIVSGVVALIRSKFPQLTAEQVVNRLTATATDKGDPGHDRLYGWGIVDPVKALTATLPGEGQPGSGDQKNETHPFRTPVLLLGGAAVAVVLVAGLALVAIRSLRDRVSPR